ncbi:MAG TPA: peptidyl-prolyl cis-trans isomerase [Terriglobales bacterium]|jgi:peptidyl-prolyl cis-trans isomerase D|nr:peptidyl-prolyl cis-trans isomerase [Terriglobales bacterium]
MIRFLQTPGPIKRIVLGSLLTLICVSMVWYLVPTGTTSTLGLGGPGQGVVATVAGEQVTTLEVQRQARQALRQQFPRGGEQVAMLLPYFAARSAQNLISMKAMVAEAERMGLRVSDDELRDELQHGRYSATFFPGGTFVGQQQYENILQNADLSVRTFEQSMMEQLLLDKLRNLVSGGVSVTDAEVRTEFLKRNTRVKFDYAVLRKDDLLKQVRPTEAELKAFYERNKATYNNSIPETRKVRYAVLDTAKIQAETTVSREELQTYYDQHRDDYRVPEQVNVRQILIKTPLPGSDGKVDPKGVEEARKKAEDVLKQLKAGANFEDLAKKSSEDPSAKSGGSVGWIQRGRFPSPDVEKAAFSLSKGGASDVINAGYAFVILRVDDKQAAHVKTLDEVKDGIEPLLKQEKAARAAGSQADAMIAQARSAGLEKAAATRGLTVVSTDFISRTDALPGIGSSPQFTGAVFNQAEKAPPDLVQIATGYAVFEVLAIKPPATPTFDEIHSRVENEFKNERVAALLSQKTQELADRAKAEHDLKKAATEAGAALKTSEFVLPEGQVPDIGSMAGGAAVAFSLKPGEISGPISNGNTGVVLSVLERQEPGPQDFDARKDQVRDALLQTRQAEMFNLFVSSLRTQMEKSGKIKINQDEMKKLTRSEGGEQGE